MNKLTKEKLHNGLLGWQPEVVYAEEGSKKLIMDVDAFNGHINWSVKYYDNGYKYVEFLDDFNAAVDYFVGEDE